MNGSIITRNGTEDVGHVNLGKWLLVEPVPVLEGEVSGVGGWRRLEGATRLTDYAFDGKEWGSHDYRLRGYQWSCYSTAFNGELPFGEHYVDQWFSRWSMWYPTVHGDFLGYGSREVEDQWCSRWFDIEHFSRTFTSRT